MRGFNFKKCKSELCDSFVVIWSVGVKINIAKK